MSPKLDIAAMDRQIAELYADGLDDEATEKLVRIAQPLVQHVARRFQGRGEPLEDLVQVASIGLMKAVERFEPARGVRFSTYAMPTIIGELKRYFRDSGWALRVPRRAKELALRVRDLIEERSKELGRSPTIKEIAKDSGLNEDEIIEGMDAYSAYVVDSLDAPFDDEGRPASAVIGSEDEALELSERWASVAPLLRTLDDRQRTILYLRFVRGLTQSQIGREIGYSQMHVSRLLSETLRSLRKRATRELPRSTKG